MNSTFFKNLFRDIKKTFSRFLSIVILIAVGVAFYAGVRATSPDMKGSADLYLNQNNFMDFKLISTLGLTKNNINEIEKIKGVTKVNGSHSLDAVTKKNKQSLVLNINSLPNKNELNKISIVSGRTAVKDNEAVVEDRFLKENNIKIGDQITLESGNASKIVDSLKYDTFIIVGSASSPIYLSTQRQLSSVGNGSVKGFVYILPSVFKSDIYTEMYVKTNSNYSSSSLLDNENYKASIIDIENNLKDIGIKINKERYVSVLKTANLKINEASDKINSSKKTVSDKFANAQSKIDDAQRKIIQGKKEIKKNQLLFNQKITDSEKQIVENKNKIQSAENEINLKSSDIENGMLQISQGKKQLDDTQENLNLGKQQAALAVASQVSTKVTEAKKNLDTDPQNILFIAQYNFINEIYEKDINGKSFDNIYDSLKQNGILNQINIEVQKNEFDKAAISIASGRQQLADKEKLLQGARTKITTAKLEIEANKKKVYRAESDLRKGKQDGIIKFSNGIKSLETGQKKIDESNKKLRSEEEKVNAQIKESEAEIQKNKDKIKDIKKPDFYVLGRSANVGYETYRQDSDRIDNIGKAFPLIFFLVAALVSLTTITRMVQENRIEIGTFKALGYSGTTIVAHYLIYSLAASLIGSVIGISFGFKLFPPLIMNAYSLLYTIPSSITPFNTKLALQASLIAILFTTVSAVAATIEELREVPASLMRPKSPKSGKIILLERVPFLWKRLSFTKKVTARNIFRYKQRLFMTVLGIAACTGLMITGFGLKGAIIGSVQNQFSKIYKYDILTTLTTNINDIKKNEITTNIMKDSNVKSVLFTYLKNGSVKLSNSNGEDAYVVIPENKDNLSKYINLTMNGKSLKLGDEGVIITQKLSNLIGKKIGDNAEITLNNKIIKVKISAITEHYIQNYIYISPKYYQKITGQKLEFNGFYGLEKNTSEIFQNNTSKTLTRISGVNSLSFKNNIYFDFNKTMKSINSVVIVLIISAGFLAFVVIYNLTNININERKRELATIKLLGFYNNELASYIYRENIILTIIGSLTGIFVGIMLNSFVINTAEINEMMLLRTIDPIYFVYSVILTISFSVIVNLAMYGEFDKIDMIESLKNAE